MSNVTSQQDAATQPLVPEPVDSKYVDLFDPRDDEIRQAGQISVYGHCRSFCVMDGPTEGQQVDDHGRWCKSRPSVHVHGEDATGGEYNVFTSLAAPYLHGVYEIEGYRRANAEPREYVEVLIEGPGVTSEFDDELDPGRRIFLSLGEARRLAASLAWLADQGDGLAGDLNVSAKERRERRGVTA